MLTITVPAHDGFDPETNKFFSMKEQTITLEHSLVAISKWESKWCKPYFDEENEKTIEETIDYIRCMTITQNVKPELYYCLSSQNIADINAYINAPMTATKITRNQNQPKGRNQFITAELIYSWMISLQIPIQFEKWHINKLMTLINVHSAETSPKKKMSKSDIYARNRAKNKAYRAKHRHH